VEDKALVEYFDECLTFQNAPAKQIANWLTGDVMAWLKEAKTGATTMPLRPDVLAEFCVLIEQGVISGKIGKDILPELLLGAVRGAVEGSTEGCDETSKGPVLRFVEAKGLTQISDPLEIEKIVDAVLAQNQQQLEQYRGGKDKLKGFFVGAVLKESGGCANPALSNEILMRKLNGE
jgi:aspartyl-tRNA(Asn)/glutamyl-tRNA(Gln) amidotransferase subunit B